MKFYNKLHIETAPFPKCPTRWTDKDTWQSGAQFAQLSRGRKGKILEYLSEPSSPNELSLKERNTRKSWPAGPYFFVWPEILS